MATAYLPSKDPSAIEPYHIVWCSQDGTNDGTTSDSGELQGATISTGVDAPVWTESTPTGITKVSQNQDAVTISGISYGVNTVCTIWLSGGTADTDYTLRCKIITSNGKTLYKSIIIPVRTH